MPMPLPTQPSHQRNLCFPASNSDHHHGQTLSTIRSLGLEAPLEGLLGGWAGGTICAALVPCTESSYTDASDGVAHVAGGRWRRRRGRGRGARGRSWRRPVSGAVESHLVLRPGRASGQPRPIIVRIPIHPRAILMHSSHVLALGHRPRPARLRGLRRRGAAVRGGHLVAHRVRAVGVVPVRVRQFTARAIAPHDRPARGVQHAQVQVPGTHHGLAGRAFIYGSLGAVDYLAPISSQRAISEDLELEGQGPPVHHARVKPVRAHPGVRPDHTEGGLELGVHRGGAALGGSADLPRAAAVSELTLLSIGVAPKLGPESGGGEAISDREIH
mmetsp:Transcript_1406/g.3369  ORF Transcript_1406/g.3369 Transcript_1406/m.3369 type:complete len:329 (+) Transcript_1406:2-988(+)